MTSPVQPYPALPIRGGHEYVIAYTVLAPTEYGAIGAAVLLLRSGVTLIGVHEARRVTGALWRVSLKVAEDA